MDSGKIFHWREDAKLMSYDEFSKAHSDLFPDEIEMKEAYLKVTGKNPEKPSKKKEEPKEGE